MVYQDVLRHQLYSTVFPGARGPQAQRVSLGVDCGMWDRPPGGQRKTPSAVRPMGFVAKRCAAMQQKGELGFEQEAGYGGEHCEG